MSASPALAPDGKPLRAPDGEPAAAPDGEPARPATAAAERPARGSRLAWLDALRGIAALFVVFDHLSTHVLQHVRYEVYRVIDPGLYGVFVFFMVSGYIVPASLERKGSIRSFWLSRLFRLFPLFIVAIAAVFVLHGLHLAGFRSADGNPLRSVFTHLLMLSDLLGGVNVINVIWTLSYEMVFYLLLTGLFAVGVHQRSARFAVSFAAGALLLGGVLPTIWLSHTAVGGTRVALAADLLVAGGLALAVAGRRLPRKFGALLAAGTGLTLVAVNERVNAYEGLTILALMFTGTMLYRAQQGQFPQRKAVLLAVAVFASTIAAGAWHIGAAQAHGHPAAIVQREWVLSLALAGATFAVGMVLREMPVPRLLAWLGLVSYSVYLLHPLVVDVYARMSWTQGHHAFAVQVALAAGFLAVLLALCSVTYYLVESPMQQLGRRLIQRLDLRFGPDRLAESRT